MGNYLIFINKMEYLKQESHTTTKEHKNLSKEIKNMEQRTREMEKIAKNQLRAEKIFNQNIDKKLIGYNQFGEFVVKNYGFNLLKNISEKEYLIKSHKSE